MSNFLVFVPFIAKLRLLRFFIICSGPDLMPRKPCLHYTMTSSVFIFLLLTYLSEVFFYSSIVSLQWLVLLMGCGVSLYFDLSNLFGIGFIVFNPLFVSVLALISPSGAIFHCFVLLTILMYSVLYSLLVA